MASESEAAEDVRGSETVLIAEDNQAVRELAASILTEYGYSVVSASSGKECLQCLSEDDGRFDLLLTDVVMPDINGKEVYGIVKAVYPKVKVLYMSGYTDDVIVHHGMLDDGVAFLQKPFSVQLLLSTVREVLDQSGR